MSLVNIRKAVEILYLNGLVDVHPDAIFKYKIAETGFFNILRKACKKYSDISNENDALKGKNEFLEGLRQQYLGVYFDGLNMEEKYISKINALVTEEQSLKEEISKLRMDIKGVLESLEIQKDAFKDEMREIRDRADHISL